MHIKQLQESSTGQSLPSLLAGIMPGQALDLGLYYQYGKKEPYLNGEYLGGGSLDISSWTYKDNKKSPTDPCPVGYRVPSATIWQGTNDINATKQHYAGSL